MKGFLEKSKAAAKVAAEKAKASAEKAKERYAEYKEAKAAQKSGGAGPVQHQGGGLPTTTALQNSIDPVLDSLISHVRNPDVKRAFLQTATEGISEEREVRIFSGTYNLNGKKPPKDPLDLTNWLDLSGFQDDPSAAWEESGPEIVALGFQEIIQLSASNVLLDSSTLGSSNIHEYAQQWADMSEAAINKKPEGAEATGPASRYVRIVARQMVGIFLVVWVRRSFLQHVRGVQVAIVGSGALGVLGNKGCIACRLRVYDTGLVLLTGHLASGQSKLAERNGDFNEFCRRLQFSESDPNQSALLTQNLPRDASGQAIRRPGNWGLATFILDHDHVIMVGDLNYRLSLPDESVRAFIKAKDYSKLLAKDELLNVMESGQAFPISDGWREGPIAFAPTYKYRRFMDSFVGDPAVTPEEKALLMGPNGPIKEKVRAPAYTDRILWRSLKGRPGGLFELWYTRAEDIKYSDHRAVSAGFLLQARQYNRQVVEEKLLEGWRVVDAKAGAMVPRCTVEPNLVQLGPVKFGERLVWRAVVKNVSQVSAAIKVDMPLLPDPSGLRDSWIEAEIPGWLKLEQREIQEIPPGGEAPLVFEVLVTGGPDGSAPSVMDGAKPGAPVPIDTILLVKISGAGDQFVSIQGQYQPTVFGLSLASQASIPRPVASATPEAAPGPVPPEFISLLVALKDGGAAPIAAGFRALAQALATANKPVSGAGPEPTRVPVEPTAVQAVRQRLDTGASLDGAPLPAIAAALFWYLGQLPEPLISARAAAQSVELVNPDGPKDLLAALTEACDPAAFTLLGQVAALVATALGGEAALSTAEGKTLTAALAQTFFPPQREYPLGQYPEVSAWDPSEVATPAAGAAGAAAAAGDESNPFGGAPAEDEDNPFGAVDPDDVADGVADLTVGEGGAAALMDSGPVPVTDPREIFRRRLYAVRSLLVVVYSSV